MNPSQPLPDLEHAVWRKSSYSGQTGQCVEVAHLTTGHTAVRDTKHHGAGPVLLFPRHQWAAFIAATKAGEFWDVTDASAEAM